MLWFCQILLCQTCVPVGSYSRLLFSCSQTCTNLVCTTECAGKCAKTASRMFCQPKPAPLTPLLEAGHTLNQKFGTRRKLRPSPLSRPSFASAKPSSMTTLFHQSRCQTCVCPKLRPCCFDMPNLCHCSPHPGHLRHKNGKDGAQAASEPKLRLHVLAQPDSVAAPEPCLPNDRENCDFLA